jgi:PAS domain S-box-containing protein
MNVAADFLAAPLSDLIEFMPDAIVLANPTGQIVLATKLAESLFGYTRGELRGQLVEALLPTRFRAPHIQQRLAFAMQPRKRSMGGSVDLFGLRKDGSEFPVEISISPFKNGESSLVLTAIRDITQRKLHEKALQELLNQNEMLLREMQHRIANSLQIIASILSLKASSAHSEEARASLRDAHQRVLSVTAVQAHLLKAGRGDVIQVAPYMEELCGKLASSIIGDRRPITLSVKANGSETGSTHAVSLGLIVTELVMNAIKYAFPTEDRVGRVIVSFEMSGSNWKLNVSDDGVGYSVSQSLPRSGSGLGTNLVKALAQQLGALVEITSGAMGTSISILHS